MAERQLPKIKDILVAYAEDLATFPDIESEYGKAATEDMREDIRNDTILQIEEVLEYMEKRSEHILEWMQTPSKTTVEVDDEAVTKSLATDYPNPDYAEPGPVDSISKSK